MQSLLALLIQLSSKSWVAIVVTIFSGGVATMLYLSSVNGGSNSTPGTPPAPIVLTGPITNPGHGAGLNCHGGSVPVVPEANAGLVLIPVVAAMLFCSSRRLWSAKSCRAAGDKPVGR